MNEAVSRKANPSEIWDRFRVAQLLQIVATGPITDEEKSDCFGNRNRLAGHFIAGLSLMSLVVWNLIYIAIVLRHMARMQSNFHVLIIKWRSCTECWILLESVVVKLLLVPLGCVFLLSLGFNVIFSFHKQARSYVNAVSDDYKPSFLLLETEMFPFGGFKKKKNIFFYFCPI